MFIFVLNANLISCALNIFRYYLSFISIGINSYPCCNVPKLPFAHSRSQNFTALPPSILSPEIKTGTGVSLCTFKFAGRRVVSGYADKVVFEANLFEQGSKEVFVDG